MFAENNEYEILTPSGWKDFRGITKVNNKKTFRLTLDNNKSVEATSSHYFFRDDEKVRLSDLKVGEMIDTNDGKKSITSIIELDKTTVYDIVEVDDEKHRYIVNSCFVTKNCDEFAYVSPAIATEFWTSISPTLSTGGKAIITSTPSTDEDTFATIWKQANERYDEHGNEQKTGRNGFFPFKASWEEHPDRDEKWKESELNRIGEEKFRREFNCEFITNDETLINGIVLSELAGEEPSLKMGQVRWYKKPKAPNMYVVALDPSMGTGNDNAAIQVYELPSYEQVAEWQHNMTNIPGQVKILKDICEYISSETKSPNAIYWSVENNGLGEAALIVIQDLGEENIPGMFISEPLRKGHVRKFRRGFNTTFSAKISACSRLKTLVENRQMKIRSKPLVSELKNFVATGSSYNAKTGMDDDLISATLLAIRMMSVLKDWDPRVYDTFKQIENEEEYEPPMPVFISKMM